MEVEAPAARHVPDVAAGIIVNIQTPGPVGVGPAEGRERGGVRRLGRRRGRACCPPPRCWSAGRSPRRWWWGLSAAAASSKVRFTLTMSVPPSGVGEQHDRLPLGPHQQDVQVGREGVVHPRERGRHPAVEGEGHTGHGEGGGVRGRGRPPPCRTRGWRCPVLAKAARKWRSRWSPGRRGTPRCPGPWRRPAVAG